MPLAGLPVVLHLLFRRKSPIVPFSTLRFVRASVQHTAARRRVQRWLLLACRVLLLLLLIWAISQPAKMLASNFFGAGRSTIAAIVVDTSYSMQFRPDQQVTLLTRADDIIGELLRDQLRDAQVAIFRSRPAPKDQPEQLESAAKIQSEWTGLKPQAAVQPLGTRVAAAVNLLKRQDADHKWLVVITDLQTREFPQPLPEFTGGRTLLLDLHPKEARAAGVTCVALDPDPPVADIGSEAVVEVAGPAGDARAVTVSISKLDGTKLAQTPPQMANFETGGRAQIRFPLKLPAERWMLVQASLGSDDPMPWDNQRQHLIEVPPRQIVTVIEPPTPPPAAKFVRLALDPNEGKVASWPLEVRRNTGLGGGENVAVALVTQWPDATTAARWREFARAGNTLVLLLEPGLEDAWGSLPDATKSALTELLPSAPSAAHVAGTFHAAPASMQDPLMSGFTDEKLDLNSITVRRFVPFAPAQGSADAILNIVPTTTASGTKTYGLLFRHKLGTGTVYTLGTMPESRFTSLGTHPLFLPLLVRMALPSADQSAARNVEIGEPIVLSGRPFAGIAQLEVENPKKEITRVAPTMSDAEGRRFVLSATDEPGLYTWHKPNDESIIAVSNVTLPAAESDLDYREAETIVTPGPSVMVAHSLAELQTRLTALSEPQPQWSPFIAAVLLLMCVEALMGSLSKQQLGRALRLPFGGGKGAGVPASSSARTPAQLVAAQQST